MNQASTRFHQLDDLVHSPSIPKVSVCLCLLALLALPFSGASANQSDQSVATQIETLSDAELERRAGVPIEEIIVTSQQSFRSLRLQIEIAEEQLYSIYNDLNEIEEFDVECRQSDWAGTHIKQHMCWPQFFTQMTAQNAQDWRFGLNILIPVDQLKNKYNDRFDEARANIHRVAREHPEAHAALLEVGKLQAAARRKREQCMAQPAFLGVFRLCKS